MLLFRGSLAFPPRPFVPGHCSCFRVVVHVQSGGTFTLRAARLSLAHRIWILPPSAVVPNPKSETNSNAQCSKAQNRQECGGFGHSLLGAWGLFRASSFGFRVSALWMAVVSRCTRGLARRSNAFTLGGGLAKLADSEHTLLKSLAAGHRDALDRAGGGQIGQ